tara:strand:+ start:166 stop:462 length:297 start_codon:yes stop_codon:yes gene_type:complete
MYDEETPPSSVKIAKDSIVGCLQMFLENFIEEEFEYTAWGDGAKNKFNKARKEISESLEKLKERKNLIFEAEKSAFEFDVVEVKENAKTLEDYLEMKE